MYLSRRINRICLVVAVIAMVPFYPIGESVYQEMFRISVYAKSIELYAYPPDWQCQLAGGVTAMFVSAVVFLALRGLAKLTIVMSGRFKPNHERPGEYPSWPH